uniref:Uncharacterized protein n=1 Tax=Chromera velia CCMP2878 TaxID=1169474 RepID=A0A0G4HUH8_9ALVE|eukprot:Cvel_31876.t1-p1 / transcript=Cvel_31876.t1 / gene=Cvel_31876 / organism=Chromera_velia_CCMP2878 / gene_product=hypothetical protein / transcript_product=hypothetical protein / location=Cvel_scaffold4835:2875-6182(+) / protein_length=983 / sequence_SO=supercontig / SO=protein_coding / is_pseudo=false
MSAIPPASSDVWNIVFMNGALGLFQPWKVSSLSKKLLELRTTSHLFVGGLASGFDDEGEREKMWTLIDKCFKRDDVAALRLLLSLKGVRGRYPFLLRRVLEKNPHSRACADFLTEEGSADTCTVLSPDSISKLESSRLSGLLKSGVVRTDSWLEIPATTNRTPAHTLPLLIALIDRENIDCAHLLLDAGARVDLCEWYCYFAAAETADYEAARRGPLHAAVELCSRLNARLNEEEEGGGDGEERSSKRQKALALLQRLAEAASDPQKVGCLHWKREDGNGESVTALGLACVRRDPEAVKILLDAQGGKVDPHVRCDLPLPMIFEAPASQSCDLKVARVMEVLADAGVDLDQMDLEFGQTPLSAACSHELVETARVLLDRGVTVGRVDRRGRMRVSPLIEAVNVLNKPLVSLLIERGADPQTEIGASEDGKDVELPSLMSPLQAALYAIDHRNSSPTEKEPLIKLLIDSGARCSAPRLPPELSGASNRIGTEPFLLSQVDPIICACHLKSPSLLRLLCDEGGGDPNVRGRVHEGDEPHPPLLLVIGNEKIKSSRRPQSEQIFSDEQSVELVEALVERGADLQVTRTDGHSPLSLACQKKKQKTAQLLLERGAAPNGVAVEGGRQRLPLIEAINASSVPLASLLLERGADPNATGVVKRKGSDGRVVDMRALPIQEAMWRDFTTRTKIAQILIDRGARCRLPSPPAEEVPPMAPGSVPVPLSQVSPLLCACFARDEKLATLLCGKGGADPNLCGKVKESQPVTELPLAFVLSDRATRGTKASVHERKRRKWKLVLALEKAGADFSLLSETTHWPETGFDEDTHWGSGSWVADLISLKDARSPLLLRIIETVPPKELEEPFLDLDADSISDWKDERGDMCPLVAALYDVNVYDGLETWSEGVWALLRRGVAVLERRNKGGDLRSPLDAAFYAAHWEAEKDCDWDIVGELIKRGANLTAKEKQTLAEEIDFDSPPLDIVQKFWPRRV